MIKGSTRWVIIIGNFAFKTPSFYNYKQFLLGLLANMQESNFSNCKELKHKLCPIVFKLPLGLLVVMPKVKILTKNEVNIELLKSFITLDNFIIPTELKYDSFGYLNNKLVVVDYGS